MAHLFDLADRNALPHAMCFVGPKGIGKRLVAETLIERIVGVPIARYPDVFEIKVEFDEKKNKMKQQVSVQDVRDGISRMSQSSLLGGKNILLIDQAELLSDGAQASLLKVMEEPRGDAVIMLIASTLDQFTAPTLSRLHPFFFYSLSDSEMQQYAESSTASLALTPNQRKLIIAFSNGSPARYNELAGCMDEDLEFLQAFFEQGMALKFASIARLLKQKQPEHLERLLTHISIILHDALLARTNHHVSPALQAVPGALTRYRQQPLAKIVKTLGILEEVKIAIKQNSSPQISLEHLALSL